MLDTVNKGHFTYTPDNREFRCLERDGDLEKIVVLQAMFRVEIPCNAQVILDRAVPVQEGYVSMKTVAIFDNPRRFALWAVKEGIVKHPKDRALVLRYARG